MHGLTPKEELQKLLEQYHPDQLLIEIKEEDLKTKKIENYPSEMIFTYAFAKENNIEVKGFDAKVEGILKKEEKELIKKEGEIIKNLSWKEMNKKENQNKLRKVSKEFMDTKKEEERQYKMLKNINKKMRKDKTIMILTGCGNLDFFKRHIKESLLPLE